MLMITRRILTRRSAVNFAATVSISFRLSDEPQEVFNRQAEAAAHPAVRAATHGRTGDRVNFAESG
jgi:hypothetical protein